jgi:hypothetical protein
VWDWFFAYGILVVGAFATACILYKEADEYLNLSKKRGSLLLVLMYLFTLFLLVAGLYQTHQTRAQASADKRQAENDRRQLEADRTQAKQDRAVSNAQLNDAKASLRTLQAKVDKLQTKAETQELSKELIAVKRELADAEVKLQQPRARFVPTFATPYYDKIPISDSYGERVPEGVKVNFGVMNTSDTTASHGEIIIRLCDACQFAGEPPGFSRVSTAPDTERIRQFDIIHDHEIVQDMSATIIVPLTATNFPLGIIVKCENCEPGKFQVLRVSIPPLVSPGQSLKPRTRTKPKARPPN